MLDWLDAIPNLGVPGVPGVEPQKTAGSTGTPRKIQGVPGVPEGVPPVRSRALADPHATLNRWETSLSVACSADAPKSVKAERWQRLLDDAAWIFQRHGLQLAQDGWDDFDAFGVSLRRPGGEVLLDRLDGSRRLHLDGKGRAAWGWSYSSVIMQACAGYAELQPAGAILPVWGLAHG